MTPEQIIAEFLKPPPAGAYTDEKLAALLAHAEDGKLSFWSCCCFAGVPTANHALQGKAPHISENYKRFHSNNPRWLAMSGAYCALGSDDSEMRAKLIPLIKFEMARRESQRAQAEVPELTTV